jgi:hypothetical protein
MAKDPEVPGLILRFSERWWDLDRDPLSFVRIIVELLE